MPTHVYEPIPIGVMTHSVDGLIGKNLFGDKFDPTEVVQQYITNCPLPAILAALAHASPKRIKKIVSEVKNKVTSSFFGRDPTNVMEFDKHLEVKFQNEKVKVTPLLYTTERSAAGDKAEARYAKSTKRVGWVPYIEKAYVVYRARKLYANLDFLDEDCETPLSAPRVMEDLLHEFDCLNLGSTSGVLLCDFDPINAEPPENAEFDNFQSVHKDSKEVEGKAFTKAITKMLGNAKKRATIATTVSTTGTTLVGDHTYAVLSISSGNKNSSRKVTLYDAMHNCEEKVSLADFVSSVDNVYQER